VAMDEDSFHDTIKSHNAAQLHQELYDPRQMRGRL
jgi:hypothetical protein